MPSPTMPSPKSAPAPVQELGERLEKIGQSVRDAEKYLAGERETRRQLVNRAVDAGMPVREIARRIGGKAGTGIVSKILSKPEPDDEG